MAVIMAALDNDSERVNNDAVVFFAAGRLSRGWLDVWS